MKVNISKKVFQSLQGYAPYIVVAKGVNNRTSSSRDINKSLKKVQDRIQDDTVKMTHEDAVNLKYWTEVFDRIGRTDSDDVKSVKVLPSHVSLYDRVVSGGNVPNVSPLVNFCNMLSLTYLVSISVDDLSELYGAVSLEHTREPIPFIGLGERDVSKTYKDEVCWHDEHSAISRNWSAKQSLRSAVHKDTTDVFIVMDFDTELEYDNPVSEIVDQLVDGLKNLFDATSVEVQRLSVEESEFEFNYETRKLPDNYQENQVVEDLSKLVKKNVKSTGKKGITKRRVESMGLRDLSTLLGRMDTRMTEVLNEAYGWGLDTTYLEFSRDYQHGDFSSTIGMRLAPQLQLPPQTIASQALKAMEDIGLEKLGLADIEVAPNGFLNMRLDDKKVLAELGVVLTDWENFATSNVGNDETILVETPSANPNKSLHIGHLMNIFLGSALLRLFEKVGFNAEQDNIVNDKGIPVFKALWAMQKFGEENQSEDKKLKPDVLVGKYYVIGSKYYDEDPEAKQEMVDMLVAWEQGDSKIRDAWGDLISKVLKGQEETLARLGEGMGFKWYESELYDDARDIILSMIDGEKVVQLEDGAVIGKIEEEYGLPDVVLLKSNGTTVYHTQDVLLTLKKIEKFAPKKAIWVVGNEHIAHFQRLFSVLDLMGLIEIENLYHYAYGFVYGKDGQKMSSRKGDALDADGLLDMMEAKSDQVLSERNHDLDEDEAAQAVRYVAMNSLKYSFLVTDPFKDMKFDVDRALSFSGQSAPYIMYAYVRANSIVSNYGDLLNTELSDEVSANMTDIDRELLLKIFEYPEIYMSSVNNYMPSYIAEYMFELAKMFNNFYENESINEAENEDSRKLRLAITKATVDTLKDSAEILGMRLVEKM